VMFYADRVLMLFTLLLGLMVMDASRLVTTSGTGLN
jgi:hypothetical protein